jgi:hypothetical protein
MTSVVSVGIYAHQVLLQVAPDLARSKPPSSIIDVVALFGLTGQPAVNPTAMDRETCEAIERIVSHFVKRGWGSACLAGSALLVESLGEGTLVSGYLVNDEFRSYLRHFWYKGRDGISYDVGTMVTTFTQSRALDPVTFVAMYALTKGARLSRDAPPSTYTYWSAKDGQDREQLAALEDGYARWRKSPDEYWRAATPPPPRWLLVLRDALRNSAVAKRRATKVTRNAVRNRKKREARKRLARAATTIMHASPTVHTAGAAVPYLTELKRNFEFMREYAKLCCDDDDGDNFAIGVMGWKREKELLGAF